jgi:hypothetical protein
MSATPPITLLSRGLFRGVDFAIDTSMESAAIISWSALSPLIFPK